MAFIIDFISQYGAVLLYTILMAVITYIGMQVKGLIKKYVDNQLIKDTVKMVCQSIEQLHKDLTGEEKLNLSIVNSKNILEEKGITISDLELRVFIESRVNSFKRGDE